MSGIHKTAVRAAARRALAQRGVDAAEIDAIPVCTITAGHLFQSTACLARHAIGATGARGFDLIAACCGFLYGLTAGSSRMMAGRSRKALVIGSATMGRITDYERTNCVLFGDGAGAMPIEPAGVQACVAQDAGSLPPAPCPWPCGMRSRRGV